MKANIKMTAVITAAAMLFASAGLARADDRQHRRGMSTTEKVLTGVAVAAAVGLTAYAISKSGDHRYQQHRRPGYVAVSYGFSPYAVGDPYGPRHGRAPRGYWHQNSGQRFYRVPYVYNNRWDRAYNAGWERGYWAGYMQGLNDARMRGRYYDRFQWNGGYYWGYERGFGSHGSYSAAFNRAFSIGYNHAFYGRGYGHNGFGFGVSYHRR